VVAKYKPVFLVRCVLHAAKQNKVYGVRMAVYGNKIDAFQDVRLPEVCRIDAKYTSAAQ